MRLSSKFVRCMSVAAATFALFTGALSLASAQDATAEPTVDPVMSQMMMSAGACPEGVAGQWFDQMSGTMSTGSTSDTSAQATMEATHDMSSMDMATEEALPTASGETVGDTSVLCLVATISGAEEVPGPGDDDAWGIAVFTIDALTGNICYDIAVANVTLPAAANHIHVGEAGVGGGVVVPIPNVPDADGKASGCTTGDPTIVNSIAMNPASYYYNVHTSDFPDGAARGQLMLWDDAMTMWTDAGMDTSEWMNGSDDMSGTNMGSDSGDMTSTQEAGTEPTATEESSG